MNEQKPEGVDFALNAGLERPDLRIIREVYCANAEFGLDMPYMVSPRSMKRAKALAELGLLKAHNVKMFPNPEGWDGFSVTQAGIDAYNSALRSNKS